MKGQLRVTRKGLFVHSAQVTIVFSALADAFIDYLRDSLKRFPVIRVGDLQLMPSGFEVQEPPRWNKQCSYLCLSPVVLLPPAFQDEEAVRFVSPRTPEFGGLLSSSTAAQFLAETGMEWPRYPEVRTAFRPDPGYLDRLDEAGKKYSRVFQVFDADVGYDVRGYTIPFLLEAPVEVHRFLYDRGLGLVTSKGFGMIDMVQS